MVVRPAPGRSGSPLLDVPGEHDCLVRASHAIGSGPEHADIEGFAIRIRPSGQDGDIYTDTTPTPRTSSSQARASDRWGASS